MNTKNKEKILKRKFKDELGLLKDMGYYDWQIIELLEEFQGAIEWRKLDLRTEEQIKSTLQQQISFALNALNILNM